MEDHGRQVDLLFGPPGSTGIPQPKFKRSSSMDNTQGTSFTERTKLFRIIDGTIFIAEVVKIDVDTYGIKNPIVLQLVQHPQNPNEHGVQMLPFMFFASKTADSITLNRNTIVAESAPDDQIMQMYNQQFGSGIVVTGSMPRPGSVPPSLITG